MEFDFRQFTGLIVAIYGSRGAFAKELGISKSALSNKLNNKTAWSTKEIRRCCELLAIPPKDVGLYFFTPKVHNCELEEAESEDRICRHRLRFIWNDMKQRCFNKNNPVFKHYGARGITVCQEWHDSFEAFYEWAMAAGYKPEALRGECTLDRIDNDGNYEPFNCRWVDMKVQSNNRGQRSKGIPKKK